MKKSRSFSYYGGSLDRKAKIKSNPEFYQKVIAQGKENPISVQQKRSKFIQGFDRVTGRQKLSSFQIYNTKEYNSKSNYENKTDFVKIKSAFYPTRIQKEPRLTKFLQTHQIYYPLSGDETSIKVKQKSKNEKILTSRDLQNGRKTYHSLDFSKQKEHSNTYIQKYEGKQTAPEFQTKNSNLCQMEEQVARKNPIRKSISVHSFTSYPSRKFFTQKILVNGVPPQSGGEWFKVAPEKYKNNWKVVSAPKFETMAKKHLNRFDRSEAQWNTKLNYYSKEDLLKKKVPVLKISLQTSRQINQVHSKYPIRVAA